MFLKRLNVPGFNVDETNPAPEDTIFAPSISKLPACDPRTFVAADRANPGLPESPSQMLLTPRVASGAPPAQPIRVAQSPPPTTAWPAPPSTSAVRARMFQPSSLT